MCEKCVEIESKINRYQRLAYAVADDLTRSRTKTLIDDLRAEKAALHPPPGK